MKADTFTALAASIEHETEGAWTLVPEDALHIGHGAGRRIARVLTAKLCHRMYPITSIRVDGKSQEGVKAMVGALVKACFFYEMSFDWDDNLPPVEFEAALIRHGVMQGAA